MRHAFEAREIVANLIVDDAAWATAQREGGWLPEGIKRLPPRGGNLHALLGYELDMVAVGRLWRHAEMDRAPAEDVVARLRPAGDALGLPPVESESGLPLFVGRRTQAPHRQRHASREVSQGRRSVAPHARARLLWLGAGGEGMGDTPPPRGDGIRSTAAEGAVD